MPARKKNVDLKRQSYSLEEKKAAVREVQRGGKIKAVALKYNFPASTLRNWTSKSEQITQRCDSGVSLKVAKVKTCKHKKLDEALLKWLKEMTARNQTAPLTHITIASYATSLADKLGIENFEASNGFLTRYLKKYQLNRKCLAGSRNAAPDTVDFETHILRPELEK